MALCRQLILNPNLDWIGLAWIALDWFGWYEIRSMPFGFPALLFPVEHDKSGDSSRSISSTTRECEEVAQKIKKKKKLKTEHTEL